VPEGTSAALFIRALYIELIGSHSALELDFLRLLVQSERL
jgi:hypothetical protein